jgi:cob(I)alamin adenosyltransferase
MKFSKHNNGEQDMATKKAKVTEDEVLDTEAAALQGFIKELRSRSKEFTFAITMGTAKKMAKTHNKAVRKAERKGADLTAQRHAGASAVLDYVSHSSKREKGISTEAMVGRPTQ